MATAILHCNSRALEQHGNIVVKQLVGKVKIRCKVLPKTIQTRKFSDRISHIRGIERF